MPTFLQFCGEFARHLDRGALLDVLQNLVIARFESDDQQPRACISHRFQSFIIAMNARIA